MSTTPLTIVVSCLLLLMTASIAIISTWSRKAASAAFLAGGFFGVLHLFALWVAQSAALPAAIWGKRLPGIAGLPTWMYDITAWIAVAFLAMGIVSYVLQRRRRKVIERQWKEILGRLFGDDEAEED